jgi:S-adenosylmethionine hydrolase
MEPFHFCLKQNLKRFLKSICLKATNGNFRFEGYMPQHLHTLPVGGTPEFLGKRTDGIQIAPMVHPIIGENHLKGHVIHIDHYGNVYTNISERVFRQHQAKRKFAVTFKRAGNDIQQISEYYTDVPEGERLAMFGSNGLLMIAINGGVTGHGGSAAQLFGLKAGDMITVEYYGDQNR